MWQAAVLWRELALIRPFAPEISAELRLGLALLWVVLWGSGWWALRSGRPFVRWLIPGIFSLYTFVQLGLTFAAASAVVRAGWPLTALAGVAAVAFSFWALRNVNDQHQMDEDKISDE